MQPTSWEVSVDHEHLVTTKTDVVWPNIQTATACSGQLHLSA